MRTLIATFVGFVAFVLLSTTVQASPNWRVFDIRVNSAADAAKVVAAADAFMASETGKKFPGRLSLLASVADGVDPTTHTFVALYKSHAEAEAWSQTLPQSEDWQKFLAALGDVSEPTATYRLITLKSWGEVANDDAVWEFHLFDAENPAGVLGAVDAFLNSPTGKKAPGQVHVSAVSFGGVGNISHVITVGYKNEAEQEAWLDAMQGDAHYELLLRRLADAAEYQGSVLERVIKSWGTDLSAVAAR